MDWFFSYLHFSFPFGAAWICQKGIIFLNMHLTFPLFYVYELKSGKVNRDFEECYPTSH